MTVFRHRFEGSEAPAPLAVGETTLEYVESGGWTYARAIQQAMADIATRHGDQCVFIGEDMEVAGAFGMNMALKNAGHADKLVDMPLCEAVIVHTGTGAALSGMRPMVEIQFGGFAALGLQCADQQRCNATMALGCRLPNDHSYTARSKNALWTFPCQHD